MTLVEVPRACPASEGLKRKSETELPGPKAPKPAYTETAQGEGGGFQGWGQGDEEFWNFPDLGLGWSGEKRTQSGTVRLPYPNNLVFL